MSNLYATTKQGRQVRLETILTSIGIPITVLWFGSLVVAKQCDKCYEIAATYHTLTEALRRADGVIDHHVKYCGLATEFGPVAIKVLSFSEQLDDPEEEEAEES